MKMIFTIPKDKILEQLLIQLKNYFYISEEEETVVRSRFDYALSACEKNYSRSQNKYYWIEEDGVRLSIFNPYHAVQYMIFLYYLSHDIYKNANIGQLCDKIYYLNKILNSVDLFYAIELPSFFEAEHPVGSVMGRAKYNNGFLFLQGCTVGGTRDKQGNYYYPELGENVQMYSNSSILGNCHIGNNVKIGAGCIVKNQDVPDNCMVFGQSPNLIIKYQK